MEEEGFGGGGVMEEEGHQALVAESIDGVFGFDAKEGGSALGVAGDGIEEHLVLEVREEVLEGVSGIESHETCDDTEVKAPVGVLAKGGIDPLGERIIERGEGREGGEGVGGLFAVGEADVFGSEEARKGGEGDQEGVFGPAFVLCADAEDGRSKALMKAVGDALVAELLGDGFKEGGALGCGFCCPQEGEQGIERVGDREGACVKQPEGIFIVWEVGIARGKARKALKEEVSVVLPIDA